jgi:hypothetical protein
MGLASSVLINGTASLEALIGLYVGLIIGLILGIMIAGRFPRD